MRGGLQGRPVSFPLRLSRNGHSMVNSTAEKLFDQASPASQRNVAPIVATLSPLLPSSGLVLEIAAGTGYHSVVLAEEHPSLMWQPTDRDDEAQSRMNQLVADAALPNVMPPLALDVVSQDWPIEDAAAILCCNMIHIAPWTAAQGLFAGAGRVLSAEGILFLYGPFKINGQHTAESNESFEEWLKSRDPEWGVRDAEDVDQLAADAGLHLDRSIEMPANNLLRVYRR